MFVTRTAFYPYKISTFVRKYSNNSTYTDSFERFNNNIQVPLRRVFSSKTKDSSHQPTVMVDPKRVVSYEDVLHIIHQPEKIIIDVRNPDEVNTTGKIPSSINIPLPHVQHALKSMSEEEFKKNYQRRKPNSSDELIFYCQSGRRSSEALNKALEIGYTNLDLFPQPATRQAFVSGLPGMRSLVLQKLTKNGNHFPSVPKHIWEAGMIGQTGLNEV